MYLNKEQGHQKGQGGVSFAEEVDNVDQEERTARGFAARKARKDEKKKKKQEELQRLVGVLNNILSADVEKLMSAAEPNGFYYTCLHSFLVGLGAPNDGETLKNQLLWFRKEYKGCTPINIADELKKGRKVAYDSIVGLYTNRDYKSAFSNTFSLSSSEKEKDHSELLLPSEVAKVPGPVGHILSDQSKSSLNPSNHEQRKSFDATVSNSGGNRKRDHQSESYGEPSGAFKKGKSER